MDYKELRESAALVTAGEAKMGEVTYGDDGRDMAEDIVTVLAERDRYRAALEQIADNPCLNPEGNANIARAALSLKGDE